MNELPTELPSALTTALTTGHVNFEEPVAIAPASTIRRVEATLDRLQSLSTMLEPESAYDVPPLDFELPDDFLLSVVIPVYNEQATILRILARVAAVPIRKEVILVDDCSTDSTRELLAPLEAAEDLRILYKSRNAGKGAALKTGFAAATGNVVMVQDADLEYDPRDIPALLRPIVRGEADVVYGSRFLSGESHNSSPLHQLGNRLLTWASNRATGLRLTDMETCYKVFRREVLRDVEIRQPRFGFEPEVTAKLARRGARLREVPIRYEGRGWEEGKKIGWRDACNALYCIVRYGWAD